MALMEIFEPPRRRAHHAIRGMGGEARLDEPGRRPYFRLGRVVDGAVGPNDVILEFVRGNVVRPNSEVNHDGLHPFLTLWQGLWQSVAFPAREKSADPVPETATLCTGWR
ncbi:predicted protein [Chaetomium globosum CBS 148.51]|uniref:Uncharacterized protein n=1 Tax=Chaetomium globosum (strain ATCC 6205 / CBS 148.51 / DSM 1962 / NBRC 6347 / NRRL 1970) TaxID=306901 RepID=Q2GZX3_CHAGB|nr:uncharacterized protein CHGG_04923 [Chaetomium globosum CBS 148.51]EAQ88304.1 predicted protein [Chaetomium globosum CBS 148.51]